MSDTCPIGLAAPHAVAQGNCRVARPAFKPGVEPTATHRRDKVRPEGFGGRNARAGPRNPVARLWIPTQIRVRSSKFHHFSLMSLVTRRFGRPSALHWGCWRQYHVETSFATTYFGSP